MIVENKADSLVNRLRELLQFISHTGEQGRLAELVISEWLRVTLPQKYSIGTGFIASIENGNLDLSSQQDIIVYDHQHCSPILKTAVGGIFPIESVYATFEVKKTLRKGSMKDGRPTELYKAFSDIAKIRRMATRKTYLKLVEGRSIATFEIIPSALSPRSYIIAYQTEINDLAEQIRSVIDAGVEYDTHYHGIVILDQDYFAWRPHINTPEARAGSVCEVCSSNGWLTFANGLLLNLESMDVNQKLYKEGCSIDRTKYPISISGF